MSWQEHLASEVERLNADVLSWESLSQVRAALEDRLRDLSGPEAVLVAAIAWFVDGLDDYQRAFDEELAKPHGARWDTERRRIWKELSAPLGELEVALRRGDDAEALLPCVGMVVQTWSRLRRSGRPRP